MLETIRKVRELIASFRAGRYKVAALLVHQLIGEAINLMPDDARAEPRAFGASDEDLALDLEAVTAAQSPGDGTNEAAFIGIFLPIILPLLVEILKRVLISNQQTPTATAPASA